MEIEIGKHKINKEILLFLEKTKKHEHGQRSLYTHLVGCYEILSSWNTKKNLCNAGLFHSIYGTSEYKNTPVSQYNRQLVKKLIGDYAEYLVYLFSILDRTKFERDIRKETHSDFLIYSRKDNDEIIIDKSLWSDLVILHVANWFEQKKYVHNDLSMKIILPNFLNDTYKYLPEKGLSQINEFIHNLNESKVINVIIFGTNYALTYFNILRRNPELFNIMGFFSRGSKKSIKVAKDYNCPIYTSLDDLPINVDLAIVAVPKYSQGELSAKLLEKGINVVSEHPIEYAAICDIKKALSKSDMVYNLNAHFSNLQQPIMFIKEAKRLIGDHKLLRIDISCSERGIFSSFDILGRVFNRLESAKVVYRSKRKLLELLSKAHGYISNYPFFISFTSKLFKKDNGKDSPIVLRITLVFLEGTLTLMNPYGPVIWSSSFYSEKGKPLWNIVGETPKSIEDISSERMIANYIALLNVRNSILNKKNQVFQDINYLERLCKIYSDING